MTQRTADNIVASVVAASAILFVILITGARHGPHAFLADAGREYDFNFNVLNAFPRDGGHACVTCEGNIYGGQCRPCAAEAVPWPALPLGYRIKQVCPDVHFECFTPAGAPAPCTGYDK